MTEEWDRGNTIVEEIAPQKGDIVVRKQKPSAFFGTPLISMLNEVHADSVFVTGTTTSGCVRASVIDAFSYNFKVSVIEECVFDRGQASHKINLFDMAMKYADVISLKEATDYIRGLPDNLLRRRCNRVTGSKMRKLRGIWVKSESNPQLQAAIIEVVENQLRNDDPPQTGQTFKRLIEAGHLRKKQSD